MQSDFITNLQTRGFCSSWPNQATLVFLRLLKSVGRAPLYLQNLYNLIMTYSLHAFYWKKKEEEDTAANSLSYMFMCLVLRFMFYLWRFKNVKCIYNCLKMKLFSWKFNSFSHWLALQKKKNKKKSAWWLILFPKKFVNFSNVKL